MDDADGPDPRGPRRRRLGRALGQALLAAALLFSGAAGGVVWSRLHAGRAGAPPNPGGGAAPAVAPAPAAGGESEPVEIALTPDAIARAGIKTAAVETGQPVQRLTVPGTVASNAYRETRVVALVGGVVTRVPAELGTAVRPGAPLAVIFSDELAQAQTKYLSMQAMFEADHQRVERTRKLVAIGAASRQELEEATAVHVGHETEVAAARQRLLLLGLSADRVARLTDASQVVSDVVVPSPVAGVVITRSVNPGQVVAAGQELFVVADLRTVWVIGDLYEKDFPLVRVGSGALITIPAGGRTLAGRVAYIDPRVDPQTRTAKVRVEVPNADDALRLGMYVPVGFETRGSARVPVVPRSAVQAVGDRTVVYVPDPGNEGQFVERAVTLGPAIGDRVEILDGVKPGERVVTEGSFFLRAEATRARSGG